MRWIKIFGIDGSIISAEELQEPVFVCYQPINKIVIRCPFVMAQGILSEDGSQIYQLKDSPAMPGDYLLAEEISQADYDALILELEIPEDSSGEIEQGEQQENTSDIMTAKEMREKIIDLTQQVELLSDCLLEMSEIVYE